MEYKNVDADLSALEQELVDKLSTQLNEKFEGNPPALQKLKEFFCNAKNKNFIKVCINAFIKTNYVNFYDSGFLKANVLLCKKGFLPYDFFDNRGEGTYTYSGVHFGNKVSLPDFDIYY